jgi:hypothetical protein
MFFTAAAFGWLVTRRRVRAQAPPNPDRNLEPA